MEASTLSEASVDTQQSSLVAEESPEVATGESVKKPFKPAKRDFTRPTFSSTRKNAEASDLSSTRVRAAATKSSPVNPGSPLLKRRNSTGGLPERQPGTALPKRLDGAASFAGKKVTPSVSEPPKTPTAVSRRSSLPSVSSRISAPEVKKTTVSASRLSAKPENSKTDSARKASIKPSLPFSASKKIPSSPSSGNHGHASLRNGTSSSKASSPSARSPSITGGAKVGSVDKGSLSGQKKSSPSQSSDSHFIMLPQVEVKSGDDLRLDLRGHRIRSLNSSGLNLSPNLEFVYLRDNLLSSLEGFNDFKGPGFEPLENCKALQQLYLAGNQITSLISLPELPNLEFLSVAQNRLKSLCMASQPRLQVLAASKNKISTLKGFPHLPLLEHLRVEENPILEMPHLEAASILLVGPTLKKFNDRDLSPNERELAKKYPAHAPLCIRYGWEFSPPDRSMDSTFRFLAEYWKSHLPPGYLLKKASVEQPFEQDTCHCHFVFVKDSTVNNAAELCLKYQWFIGEKTPTNFVSVADAVSEVYWPKHEDVGRYLKVECTPVLEGTEYSPIFAISSPVCPGTGCPKVINLTLHGELMEGSVIKGFAEVAWCGGTPAKGVASWLRRRWNSSPVVITGAEDEEYSLTADDIDCSLVFMYTPVTEEGIKGEPQYAMTDFVKPAFPSVRNVRILGDAVEGNTIKGVGEYIGGKEGPSKFEWLREQKENGELHVVSVGAAEYTLTKDDVGRRLSFVYIPINFEGQEGESVTVMSEKIRKAPPRVSNLKIVGDVREGNKVTVTAIVTGGTEGSSKVQWFKKAGSSKFEDESSLEALSTSKIAKAFRVPLGAVGYYLAAKFTPIAPDGETGEPAYAISEKSVETLPPSLNFLSVVGNYYEGDMLTASYGYIGGHEGISLYDWFLHGSETDSGTLIPEASGFLQYRITKDAIDKFVSFKCTPVRDDGSVGEPRTCLGLDRVQPGSPRLLSLQIIGEAIEGITLVAEKKYWGGEEGNSVFRWFLKNSDGVEKEIKGASAACYTPSSDDIGCTIYVSCEPVRNDGACGPTVLSELVGPVLPGPPACHSLKFLGSMTEGERLSFTAAYVGGERGECTQEWYRVKNNRFREKLSNTEFLDLTLSDVGRCIELFYTPIRKDGLRGTPVSIVSIVISPAEPKGSELVVPDCSEDHEVVPQKSYYGGEEGNGQYVWYRSRRKLEGSELRNISHSNEAVICGKMQTYTPSLEDVGLYLILYWVPTRVDGKRGDPLVAISNSPVTAAPPVVSGVQTKELSVGVYIGEGIYYGGHEGSSMYSWYRETNEGAITLIDGANSNTYEVTDLDYNSRLLFGYTPVRSDSVVGELRLSERTDIILPEIPKIQRLSFAGSAVEGEILTAVEIIPESITQRNVWSKYKEKVKYQWFITTESDDARSFEVLSSQRSCSYKLQLKDIGRCLRCECIATDVFGRSSEPVSAVTSPILPGIPKITKLEIEGRGFHTNLYAVRGTYFGGKEGKSKIQWLRSMVGSPDLISIPGETGRMYEGNVDDVGYRLVAVYTPVREDGAEGEPVSASTEPITVEPDVYNEVKQKVELGSLKFEVLCERGQSAKAPGSGNLERRILEVNRKRVKVVKPGSKTSFPTTEIRGSYAPPFHVEVLRNDQHRFKVVVDGDNEVELIVQTRHLRDLIVLVIRGLAQRFNSTSLNSLLKIET
ncbi:unnamed protein product [Spirodela intermedia]|uniref:Uncharacterized protein n=1 Tax=Spirodela intermedia TaxID=51605 RepID=A0A7I8IJ51_SPIIN|nr:unnamed protein product [Spirodela intermedia]CAA6657906.1 unnamed protein product [Spirodela intermedia]